MGVVADGRDIWCLDSLRPGVWATGVQLVAQRCYRRLITPAGTLIGGEDEQNFGLDLASFIGSTDVESVQAMMPARVRNELLKDPAVEEVTVDGELSEIGGGRVTWRLTIDVTTTEGDVELIVGVDGVTVELIGVVNL
jgi:hypothetical protein